MNYLVAVDGSTESETALEHALELAAAVDDQVTVTVVHSVDPEVERQPDIPADADVTDTDGLLVLEGPEEAEERGQRTLDRAVEFAAERGHEIEAELLYGTPAERIGEFAETGGFDALFVGHRGLGERYERLLGSTAKRLVESTTVPVTVVS